MPFNHLYILLKLFPDKDWDWYGLSKNPNITWDMVKDKAWKWNELNNPNITWKIVRDNKDWNWSSLSQNPNITWDIVKDNPDEPWNWHWVSQNPNITWDMVKDNLDKAWKWSGLSNNPNITWKIIRDNSDKDWNWDWLSNNPFNRYNAAVTIQRWWRKYRFRLKHKKIYKYVMTELTHKPKVGIDYFKTLKEVEHI